MVVITAPGRLCEDIGLWALLLWVAGEDHTNGLGVHPSTAKPRKVWQEAVGDHRLDTCASEQR
eukprot:11943440-Prorocentrum_lima.AAC.1